MLKRKISKATFDALPKDVQAFYSAAGDEYVLQVETHPDDDPAELKRALAREKENAKTEKARADRLQTENEALVADPSKRADLATLENSWKNKLKDKEDAWTKKETELTRKLHKALANDKALELARSITEGEDNAQLLLPHIVGRLQVDTTGDEAITRVLDGEGKPSAATLDEFKKEIVANKKFSGIIVASKASGGADTSKRTSTSAVPKDKKFNDLTDAERTQWYKDDPEGFKKAANEAKRANRKF